MFDFFFFFFSSECGCYISGGSSENCFGREKEDQHKTLKCTSGGVKVIKNTNVMSGLNLAVNPVFTFMMKSLDCSVENKVYTSPESS